MARKNYTSNEVQQQEETVQNTKPLVSWRSFDSFWNECVKNGTPGIKSACKAHFQTLGVMDNQAEWVKAAEHFGIPIEK